MEEYSYEARDAAGCCSKGEVQADNRREAVKYLRAQGLFVAYLGPLPFWRRCRLSRMAASGWAVLFCRQLAIMTKAGLPIVEAAAILCHQAQGRKQRILQNIVQELQAGSPLSMVLQHQHGIFPASMISLLAAGESGGCSERLLQEAADALERGAAIQEKMKTALLYPAFLLVMTLLVFLFLLGAVLPAFAVMYQNLGMPLPLPTRIVLDVTQYMVSYGWQTVLVLASACLFLFMSLRERQYVFLAKVSLQVPIFGCLCQRVEQWRFFMVLSLLQRSGIVMDEAVSLAAAAVQNRYFRQRLQTISPRLYRGSTLTEACQGSRCFTPLMIELLGAGEAVGETALLLERLAVLCQQEADTTAQRLQVLIEPVMIVFLGLIVGGLVMSMIYPLLNAVDAF